MNRHELLARLKELEATVIQREMTMAEGWKQAAEARARVAELERLLNAAWQATGVASAVRGLALLDDVIATQRSDLLEALTERDMLSARLDMLNTVGVDEKDAGWENSHRKRLECAAERDGLKARLDALIDFCSRAEDGNIINGRAFKHAIAAAKGEKL